MAKKSLKNFVVSYNGTDITPYLNKASLDATAEAIDTTSLASDGKEQTAGASSFSVPVSGNWAKALDDVLGVDAASPPATLRTLVVTIGPSGGQVINTWTGTETVGAFVSDYKVAADDPLGVLTWSGTLTVSGAPVRT
jgi:hypothetical protein